jgi:predicted N-acetyltransferase YhbS
MYEVRQYPSPEVPPEIACQIASFVRLVWLNDLTGDDRFWSLEGEAGMTTFVICERGVLISHANVIQRTITYQGESYLMYGLGGVFTYPAFRGEGYGGQVVEAATQFIRSSDADVGMLFCDPKRQGFYGNIGWLPLDATILAGAEGQAQPVTDEPMMILYLSDKAKAHRTDFEGATIYVGEYTW